jgi:hypothetical protein
MTEWRQIPGFPRYQVSNEGSVRSIKRVDHDGTVHYRPPLKWQVDPREDRPGVSVQLRRKGKKFRVGVGPAVLAAFVGPRPDGMECCHNDGNCLNNRLENLRWGTHADNMQDRLRHGTNPFANKTHCAKGHPLERLGKSHRRGCRVCRNEQSRNSHRKLSEKRALERTVSHEDLAAHIVASKWGGQRLDFFWADHIASELLADFVITTK